MNQGILDSFEPVVHELFIRWDALRLAVEHMGGRTGQQTARDIRDYVFKYCTQNENIHPSELIELLNDVIDEEFNTICEDNSVNDLSVCLVEYLKLCIDGKLDELRQRLSTLPKCVNWLDPSFKITPAPKAEDDSDTDSDSESDEDMDVSSNDEAPALVDGTNRNQRNRPQVDEDGWTTIPTRRRQ